MPVWPYFAEERQQQSENAGLWQALHELHPDPAATPLRLQVAGRPGAPCTFAARVTLRDGTEVDYIAEGVDRALPFAASRLRRVRFPSWPPPVGRET